MEGIGEVREVTIRMDKETGVAMAVRLAVLAVLVTEPAGKVEEDLKSAAEIEAGVVWREVAE